MLICSRICSLIHWFIHLLICWFVHAFVHWFIHLFIYTFYFIRRFPEAIIALFRCLRFSIPCFPSASAAFENFVLPPLSAHPLPCAAASLVSAYFLEVSKILYFWLSFIKSAVLNGFCLFSCSSGKIKWFLLIFKVSTHFQEVGWFLWSRQINWFLLIFIKLVKLCSYGSFSCSLQNFMVFAFSWSQ